MSDRVRTIRRKKGDPKPEKTTELQAEAQAEVEAEAAAEGAVVLGTASLGIDSRGEGRGGEEGDGDEHLCTAGRRGGLSMDDLATHSSPGTPTVTVPTEAAA